VARIGCPEPAGIFEVKKPGTFPGTSILAGFYWQYITPDPAKVPGFSDGKNAGHGKDAR
jgi:hypothetical protein